MLLLRVLAATLLLVLPAAAVSAAPPLPPGFTAAWATSPQLPSKAATPGWSETGFSNHTLRQVVRISAGGFATRVRLTNRYGATPLRVTGASLARTGAGASIQPETLRTITFGFATAFQIPPGADLTTDPVVLPVAPFDSLTVTLYLADPTGPATQHAQSFATSYRSSGDHRGDPTGDAFTETTQSWYYLSRVEVANVLPGHAGIVAFGDSITDGAGSTSDADNRFPDELAERLAAVGNPRAVLNQGIGGNRVTVDSAWLGASALHRFRRDVLEQPGIATVIILAGINDIGLSAGAPDIGEPAVPVTTDQLIAGYRDLIRSARDQGLRVIGATLLPMRGSPYDTSAAEAQREAVNHWIRTSGEYDAIIDFDTALADPTDPGGLAPAFDSGDHLHPSDAGYAAMAAAATSRDLD